MTTNNIEAINSEALPSLLEWCDKHEASRITGLSALTLRDWRLDGRLVEGIHWIRIGTRCVRYNSALLRDYVATQLSPTIHQRAVDNYLASLPSNKQKHKNRRKV
jgi:hypothetical protein